MKKIILISLVVISCTTIAKKVFYKFPKVNDPQGMVELGYGDYNNEVEPIYLYEIDGIDVGKRITHVPLSPGKHVLKSRTKHDLNNTYDLDGYNLKLKKGQKFVHTDKNNSVEVMIEDGKVYYLGFSVKGNDPDKWHALIYKVKDAAKK